MDKFLHDPATIWDMAKFLFWLIVPSVLYFIRVELRIAKLEGSKDETTKALNALKESIDKFIGKEVNDAERFAKIETKLDMIINKDKH